MNYLSVCSGIEAATVAWHHMGWKPVGFSEVEPFPCAVLGHHYPQVKNFGDMTKFKEWNLHEPVNVLVGGTPCQSFSVAGLRQGLKDPRGNLMLTYLAIAERYWPQWLVWENVPGVLSSNRGRDFGTFLGALVNLGYGFAYRVLDAQWFGVAQRRRRVFVVGYLGEAECAAKVLFESESVCRNSTPSRKTREGTTRTFVPSVAGSLDTECGGEKLTHQSIANGHIGGEWQSPNGQEVVGSVLARDCKGIGNQDLTEGCGLVVASAVPTIAWIPCPENCGDFWCNIHRQHTGDCKCPPIEEWDVNTYGLQMQGPAHNLVLEDQGGSVINVRQDGTVGTLRSQTKGHEPSILSFASDEKAGTLRANPGSGFRSDGTPVEGVAIDRMQVRRLTPVECERLQGFPDRYTEIPWRKKPASDCPDGPRYKALGNSMAVTVMRWIGERIAKVESM
jgi:DNA (cytosine-5)-methyltransferase 1